jgi:hypothetical protein
VNIVMKEPKLWLCLYDIHFPQYDRKTFSAILSFIRQNAVHGLLLGVTRSTYPAVACIVRRIVTTGVPSVQCSSRLGMME